MYKISKGFTIVELVVVIAIITVLATIVLINISNTIQQSKTASVAGDLHTLSNYAATFYTARGHYFNTSDVKEDNTYDSLCTSTEVSNMRDTINGVSPDGFFTFCLDGGAYGSCGADKFVFYVYNGLPTREAVYYFCVDTTGVYQSSTRPNVTSCSCF